MFRTRPAAYALTCVALWFIQLCVNTFLVCSGQAQVATHQLLLFNLATTVVLGILILLQVPRALQWPMLVASRYSLEYYVLHRTALQAIGFAMGMSYGHFTWIRF